MRLREIITIYLAIGAPLAATYFLRRRASASLLRALLSGAAVATLWPLAALISAFVRRRASQANQRISDPPASEDTAGSGLEERVERARDGLLAALRRVEELAPATLNVESEKLKRAARDSRVAVERYVALALAVEQVGADAAPSAQEMELNRVVGRTGDDLLLAGRCVRRRNAARLS
ncbi:MAG: hypothetical protein LC672_01755, partial [Acidobacteria bacterium]|nr:hypothetical protein [Acidobacteriota bacterium]